MININNFKKISETLLKDNVSTLKIKSSGDCMFPFYSNGDILIVKKQENYNIGDIIVGIYENRIIAHRILEYNDKIFHVKGDNSLDSEQIIMTDIIGLVIGKLIDNHIILYDVPCDITNKIVDLSLQLHNIYVKYSDSHDYVAKSKEFYTLKKFLNNIDVHIYKRKYDI